MRDSSMPGDTRGENPELYTFLRSLALHHAHKQFVRQGAVNGLEGLETLDLEQVGLNQADQRLFLRALRTLPKGSALQRGPSGVNISFDAPRTTTWNSDDSGLSVALEAATAELLTERRAKERAEEIETLRRMEEARKAALEE